VLSLLGVRVWFCEARGPEDRQRRYAKFYPFFTLATVLKSRPAFPSALPFSVCAVLLTRFYLQCLRTCVSSRGCAGVGGRRVFAPEDVVWGNQRAKKERKKSVPCSAFPTPTSVVTPPSPVSLHPLPCNQASVLKRLCHTLAQGGLGPVCGLGCYHLQFLSHLKTILFHGLASLARS